MNCFLKKVIFGLLLSMLLFVSSVNATSEEVFSLTNPYSWGIPEKIPMEKKILGVTNILTQDLTDASYVNESYNLKFSQEALAIARIIAYHNEYYLEKMKKFDYYDFFQLVLDIDIFAETDTTGDSIKMSQEGLDKVIAKLKSFGFVVEIFSYYGDDFMVDPDDHMRSLYDSVKHNIDLGNPIIFYSDSLPFVIDGYEKTEPSDGENEDALYVHIFEGLIVMEGIWVQINSDDPTSIDYFYKKLYFNDFMTVDYKKYVFYPYETFEFTEKFNFLDDSCPSYESSYDKIQWGCRGDDQEYSVDLYKDNELIFENVESGYVHSYSFSDHYILPSGSYLWKIKSDSGEGGYAFEGAFYVNTYSFISEYDWYLDKIQNEYGQYLDFPENEIQESFFIKNKDVLFRIYSNGAGIGIGNGYLWNKTSTGNWTRILTVENMLIFLGDID